MSKKLNISISTVEPKRYTVGIFGMAFTILAVITIIFESIPSAADPTGIKFLLMLFFGFAFGMLLVCRFTISIQQMLYGMIGIGFGAGLIILLSIIPQAITSASATSTQLTLLAPVSEEWFFRMGILGLFIVIGIKIHFELLAYIALIPVAAIFAWFHAYVYEVELTQVFIPLFLGGVIFGLAILLTKTVDAGIWAHLFVNAASLGLLHFIIF